MKILVVSPVPTDPPDAGNRARIATLTTALAQAGHELHFAYAPMESADHAAMAQRFGPGRLHHLPWAPRSGTLTVATRLARKLARMGRVEAGYMRRLDEWYDPRITDALRRLQASQHFDAVFVEYVFMSKAFEAFGEDGPLRVLDTHDSFGLRHRHYLAAGMEPQWFSTSLAEEETGFRRADIVLAIQASEAAAFSHRLTGGRTRVLQIGHLIDMGQPVALSSRVAAVFVGSGNTLNVAGARYFIDQVLPLIKRTRPEFELLLAGSVASQVENAPGVVKMGFVPHLRDAFGAAMISVNPVLAGTGVNIKLLDAMAIGMPIVSTASGARGLAEHAGSAFMVVPDDKPSAFAAEVLRLLADPAQRARLGAGAVATARAWNDAQLRSLQSALSKAFEPLHLDGQYACNRDAQPSRSVVAAHAASAKE